MGKFSNMLYMIDLLNTGNKYSIKDLSERIGVSERMIRYYKEEIEKNGIYIESFKGPGGGYFLLDKVKNYTNINKYDLQLLENVKSTLKNTKFEFNDEIEEFVEKCNNMYNISSETSKFISNIEINENNKIASIIQEVIKKGNKLEIIYKNLDGSLLDRVIYPLQFFKFKEKEYVTAFCDLRKDIRHFEISRIVKIK